MGPRGASRGLLEHHMIRLTRPWLGPEEQGAVADVLRSGMLVQGGHREEALRMLGAIEGDDLHKLVLRQIASDMEDLGALDGLKVSRSITPAFSSF